MPTVSLKDGGSLHYELVGQGAPVVLIAGMGGAASYWKPQIGPLSRRFSLVLYDQRGSGQSSKDEIAYNVPQMADELIAILDHARLSSAHLVGHAAGAAIAQEVALRYPECAASLVLFGGWARIDPYFRRAFEIRKALLQDSGRLAYVKSMPLFLNTPAWVSRNIDVLEAEEPSAAEQLSPTNILLSRIDAFCAYEPAERLRKISCPTLVCAAKDDHLVPFHSAEELERLIPGAMSHYFETGGHAVSHEQPELFNSVIESFIGSVVSQQAGLEKEVAR